jgi:hypothetical protein
MYVGMTRARNRLFLTFCLQRPRPGGYPLGPSRFIGEAACGASGKKSSEQECSTPATPVASVPSGTVYSRGNLVKHPRYGKGIVLDARRRGAEWELKIDFGFDEAKTLLTGYVPVPVLKQKASPGDME